MVMGVIFMDINSNNQMSVSGSVWLSGRVMAFTCKALANRLGAIKQGEKTKTFRLVVCMLLFNSFL